MEKEAKNLIYKALKLRPYDLELLTSAFEISSSNKDLINLKSFVKEFIHKNPYEYSAIKILLLIDERLDNLEESYRFLNKIIDKSGIQNTSAVAALAYLESITDYVPRSYFNLKRDFIEYDLSNNFSKERLNILIDNIENNFDAFKDPEEQSLKGGDVRYLKKNINREVDAFFKELSPYIKEFISLLNQSTNPLVIPNFNQMHEGIWTISIKNEGNMLTHFHPRGIISGVIYLELEEGKGGEFILGCSPSNFKKNGCSIKVQAKQLKLLLFPSYYFHKTLPYIGKKDRICLSFDFMTEEQKERNY